jgi:hypothetical protein
VRVEHAAHMGNMRNGCNILVGKPEGKRSFGSGYWGGGVVDWIHLARDKILWGSAVNTVMSLRIP